MQNRWQHRLEVERFVMEVEGQPCAALPRRKVPILVHHRLRAAHEDKTRLASKRAGDLFVLDWHFRTSGLDRRRCALRASGINTKRKLGHIGTSSFCNSADPVQLIIEPVCVLFIRNRPNYMNFLFKSRTNLFE